jgi:hypothetical protein
MTTLDTYLRGLAGRCPTCGYHLTKQRCVCQHSEWAIFTAALRTAAREDGTVHQGDVRPLIQAIPHKHRGLLYRRARQEGLLVEDGWEQSTDVAGRNSDKQQRRYRLAVAA